MTTRNALTAQKFRTIAARAESSNPRDLGFAVLASGTVVEVLPDGATRDPRD